MRIDDYAPCHECGARDVMREASPYCLRCGQPAATWQRLIRTDPRIRALWDRVQALEAADVIRRSLREGA